MSGFIAAPVTLGQLFSSPEELFGILFEDVQNNYVFSDSKTFADCIPLKDPALIIENYAHAKNDPDFDLAGFVNAHFQIPSSIKADYLPDMTQTTEQHIRSLWPYLTRQPEFQERGGSLIPLPNAYVVPGGRFREIYYWDSYFTMIGLKASGRSDLIQSMIDNFAYLINTFGHIPNGNRTYYLSRSQAPYFSLMVLLYSEMAGKKVLATYLPELQKEYDYWMDEGHEPGDAFTAHRRVVNLPNGVKLNRYWDDKSTPRPESFREDMELAKEAYEKYQTDPGTIFRHLRAAAESGWDFSSRWFDNEADFATIQTTDIIPIDLNCLMFHLEKTLSQAYLLSGQPDLSRLYEHKADTRSDAIETYFWDRSRNYYMDYNFVRKESSKVVTLAGAYPLFFKLASKQQSHYLRAYIRLNFMKSGGLLTTQYISGQQWDAPNGWAPLQWITYKGLRNYNFHKTASELRDEWISLNDKEFKRTGTMLEKYNVSDTNLEAGGGEYDNQEGFGWTNGVYLGMKNGKKK